MNNYQNHTPPPVLRNHHQHQQPQQLHHNNHHFSTTTAIAAVPSTMQLTPLHQMHHLQQNHGIMLQHHQHHFTTPAAPLPPLPSTSQSLTAAAVAAASTTTTSSSSSSAITNLATPQQQPQPLISNSLAIRQEIQRFESVHPSIYAIYDLIDLLPITDAQIAQQIRDHVVCIEAMAPATRGWILNSQAKKALKNIIKQMPCGWPEYGIPPLAPYTNPDWEVHLAQSVVDSIAQFLLLRCDGLDLVDIKQLKIYNLNKKVKFHLIFKQLNATAFTLNTNTFVELEKLGLKLRYEGSGPLEFSLENLSFKGEFKYKAPLIFGSLEIYKFKIAVTVVSVRSNIGGILGNGKYNALFNDQIEYLIPATINGNQAEISDFFEENFVPRVNAMLKGNKLWSILVLLGNSKHKCRPTPAPWLAKI